MRLTTTIVLCCCTALVSCAPQEDVRDAERLAVADEMIDAWNTMDWDRMYDTFAEDGILHSVMIDPIVGRETIRRRLTPLLEQLDRIELQIGNKGVVGDVVMFERVDDFVYKGVHSRVPVVGVMEISNGKVDVWREYYDKASLAAALSPPSAQANLEDEILALTEKLSEDWNSGDMKAYLDAYSNDVEFSLLFQDRVVSSKKEMKEFFTSTWTTEEAMGDFETDQVGVREIAPGTILARGLFEHRFPNSTVEGSFSHVWQKNNAGSWKIIHEHTSARKDE